MLTLSPPMTLLCGPWEDHVPSRICERETLFLQSSLTAVAEVTTVAIAVRTTGLAWPQHWPGLGKCLWGVLQGRAPGISSSEHLYRQAGIQTHIQAFTAVGGWPQFLPGQVHRSGQPRYPTTYHPAIPELVIQEMEVEPAGSFLQHAAGTQLIPTQHG